MTKGISPLIAAILLIAFTMTIAGLMAAWATTFSTENLQKSSECAGALQVLEPEYDSAAATLYVKVRNTGPIQLTNLIANVDYPNRANNQVNLPVIAALASKTTFEYSLGANPEKPRRIEIIADNCFEFPVSISVL